MTKRRNIKTRKIYNCSRCSEIFLSKKAMKDHVLFCAFVNATGTADADNNAVVADGVMEEVATHTAEMEAVSVAVATVQEASAAVPSALIVVEAPSADVASPGAVEKMFEAPSDAVDLIMKMTGQAAEVEPIIADMASDDVALI